MEYADLGEWIYQYLKFMDSGYGSRPFTYEKSKDWGGPTVTFDELTIWILASAKDSPARAYAKMWDNAFLTYIQYARSVQKDDWESFVRALDAMRPQQD